MDISHSIGTRGNYAKIVSNRIPIEMYLILLAARIVEMLDMVRNRIGNGPMKLRFRWESFVVYHLSERSVRRTLYHVQVNRMKWRHETIATESRWKVERVFLSLDWMKVVLLFRVMIYVRRMRICRCSLLAVHVHFVFLFAFIGYETSLDWAIRLTFLAPNDFWMRIKTTEIKTPALNW